MGEDKDLFKKSLVARDFNLIFPKIPAKVKAKIRYNQKEQWATAKELENGRVYVEFSEPQRAIARGRAVVLYEDDAVVGGGTIE